jgi:hypothetical protein
VGKTGRFVKRFEINGGALSAYKLVWKEAAGKFDE